MDRKQILVAMVFAVLGITLIALGIRQSFDYGMTADSAIYLLMASSMSSYYPASGINLLPFLYENYPFPPLFPAVRDRHGAARNRGTWRNRQTPPAQNRCVEGSTPSVPTRRIRAVNAGGSGVTVDAAGSDPAGWRPWRFDSSLPHDLTTRRGWRGAGLGRIHDPPNRGATPRPATKL